MNITLNIWRGGRLNLRNISLAKLTGSDFLNLAWARVMTEPTVSAIASEYVFNWTR